MTTPHDINLAAVARRAMATYGFKHRFSKAASAEARSVNEKKIFKKCKSEVRDLRSLLWSSIDNADSLDFDQLEYCERCPNHDIAIKVAIADVDAFAARASRIDTHASYNATSVYTGVEIFPMLPPRLSTDLSSLRAGHDRLAIIVEFIVQPNGNIRCKDIYRAWVRNAATLIYEEIGGWLEGISPIPSNIAAVAGLAQQIRLQHDAASRLHAFRMESGALELETIEAKPLVENSRIIDLVIQRKNYARYLIENFMIAANKTLVWFLEQQGIATIQRVVRTPKNWKSIIELAAPFGCRLPSSPHPRALSKFMATRRKADPERFPDLSLAVVKLLGPGEYMAVEPGKVPFGHFGLAVRDYTHATAPNRRYIDLVIQRILKAALYRKPAPYSRRELISIAAWCTDRDKAAKKVERFMRKVAAAVLLSPRIGEAFDALVTGVSEKGTYARLCDVPAEGRIIRNEAGLDIGQKIRVRLVGMDAHKGFIDFERIGTHRTIHQRTKERHSYRREMNRRVEKRRRWRHR